MSADLRGVRLGPVVKALPEIGAAGRSQTTPNNASAVDSAKADATIDNESGTHTVASDDETVATATVAADASTLTGVGWTAAVARLLSD